MMEMRDEVLGLGPVGDSRPTRGHETHVTYLNFYFNSEEALSRGYSLRIQNRRFISPLYF